MNRIALSAATVLSVAIAARAGVVYDAPAGAGHEYIDQQVGNAYSNIGDTVTPAAPGGTLTTITIPFATTYYSGSGTPRAAFDYTPDLTLTLYDTAADAGAETHPIGSAEVNNVTFHNDGTNLTHGGNTFNVEDRQNLTFDFTSQDISLPATFAFAYRDTPPAGSEVDGANGLSVFLTDGGATTGAASTGYFYTYNDTLDDPTSPSFPTTGLNVEAQISTVPEPASLGLLAVGGLTLLRRRARRA